VNCIINTKWYKGSDGRNPRLAAALTIQIPITGRRMYRTKITPTMIDSLTFDERKPI
jgi:hypothetical protein